MVLSRESGKRGAASSVWRLASVAIMAGLVRAICVFATAATRRSFARMRGGGVYITTNCLNGAL
jgi:hypothetical protein